MSLVATDFAPDECPSNAAVSAGVAPPDLMFEVMQQIFLLFRRLVSRLARSASGPGDEKLLMAEFVPRRLQLLILSRSRQRSTNFAPEIAAFRAGFPVPESTLADLRPPNAPILHLFALPSRTLRIEIEMALLSWPQRRPGPKGNFP